MAKTITVVDLGNFNIKYTAGTADKDETGMFSSKISTDYQAYEDGFQRIELNGMKTYIGIGALSKEFNKAERDYLPQLLYAVCRANRSDTDIIETNLTLLLPIIQMENKTKLIDTLKGKEFDFKYNGQDRILKIDDMIVLPEGYMAYFNLSDEDKQGDICILDCGSRTINLCVLNDGEIQKLSTVKLGSFDFYSQIKNQENAKGNDYVEEDIPRLIKNGIIKVYQKQYSDFLEQILNAVKGYVNLKTYRTIFTGGTSLLLQDAINKLGLPSFKITDDPLNSNLFGAKIASEIIWATDENAK